MISILKINYLNIDIVRKTLKRSFWLYYDHLGLFLIVNLLWCVLSCTIILLPAATFSVFYLVRIIIEKNNKEDILVKDYLSNIFSCFFKRFFCLFSFILGFLFISYVFFVYTHLKNFQGLIYLSLTGLCFCFLILYMFAIVFLYPLCENKEFYGIKNIYNAVLLGIISYPFSTLFLLIFLLSMKFIMFISLAGILFVLTTFNIVVLVNYSYIIFVENLNKQSNDYLNSLENRKISLFPVQD